MKPLINNTGIDLVTALMLTLISLTIVMYLMTMITTGIKQSGANKRYKTALEAAYGSTELVTNEILPTIFSTTFASQSINPTIPLGGLYSASLHFASNTDACLMEKLTKSSSQWTCNKTNEPKESPDFKITLNSASSDSFTVYTKIVETICSDKRAYPTGKCTGSDLSGVDLDGGQGTTGSATGISVKAMPAVYRIEVRGEKTTNPVEKSQLSVLYAY